MNLSNHPRSSWHRAAALWVLVATVAAPSVALANDLDQCISDCDDDQADLMMICTELPAEQQDECYIQADVSLLWCVSWCYQFFGEGPGGEPHICEPGDWQWGCDPFAY